MEPKSIQEYIEIARRRKWWIIIPFVLVMMGSFILYKKLPKIYQAQTLILVQPQRIPTAYVQPTITTPVSDRIATIRQQVLSRSSLEHVIRDLHLVNDPSDAVLMSQKVKLMRKAIKIDVHRGTGGTSAFGISLEDTNPIKAAQIVNKIASLFIIENLKVRDEQAKGTTEFLDREKSTIEKRLSQKEGAIRTFKEKHMGELPGQLDANLRILEGLQRQSKTDNEAIASLRQRKAIFVDQLDQIGMLREFETADRAVVPRDPLLTQLNKMRGQLQELLIRYTDKHPDVIAAKANIEKLEIQYREREAKIQSKPQEMTPSINPARIRLNAELQEVNSQIDQLLRRQADIENQIALYRQSEEQMSTLLRDYRLLQDQHQSLLNKKIQAELAENLERRRKSEQFKILDLATPPTSPNKPDKRKVFGLAFVLGLVLGGGLAYLREFMDPSFHKVDDVEEFLGLPVIATIPKIETKKNVKRAA
jgi:polysaccharide chain length determinant protein (PEP-CTERM system associated)